MKEPNRKVFQIPKFMLEADTPIHVWKRDGEVAQISFGSYDDADRLILRNNQHGFSLKTKVWSQDAHLISTELSSVKCVPSVHTVGNCIVYFTGNSQVGQEKMPDSVALKVHSNNHPYLEICKTIVPKLDFN